MLAVLVGLKYSEGLIPGRIELALMSCSCCVCLDDTLQVLIGLHEFVAKLTRHVTAIGLTLVRRHVINRLLTSMFWALA